VRTRRPVTPSALTALTALAGGLRAIVAERHRVGRMLAIVDSRALVRCLFLSSGVRSGWLVRLGSENGASLEQLASMAGVIRIDRLEAWLAVGCELGELRAADGRFRLQGRRARAIAAGDRVLAAHYASMLDYQGGPYADLDRLLDEAPGHGRGDIDRYAGEIAEVSLAAMPFVAPLVRRVLTELRPARVLDAGCGSAVYSRVVLDSDPRVQVTGVDLSEEVVERAGADLVAAGFGGRTRLVCDDIEVWCRATTERFDLVMLHNNIYYIPPTRRTAVLRTLAERIAPGGELLVTTMTRPGSVASAHLHLMLTAQAGDAALPTRPELLESLSDSGLQVTSVVSPVPSEPYLAVRAVPAEAGSAALA
jgi:4-hydroxy-2,2'-bipyrrole-5-carbaldehyde O-methyltransferase